MDRSDYTDETYQRPHVPPATAPTIDPNADPLAAAELANDDGDSDHPGPNEADTGRGREGREIEPGGSPDEVIPDEGDLINPDRPDEIDIERGGASVQPADAPAETLLPPD